jgi:hypothetical protein
MEPSAWVGIDKLGYGRVSASNPLHVALTNTNVLVCFGNAAERDRQVFTHLKLDVVSFRVPLATATTTTATATTDDVDTPVRRKSSGTEASSSSAKKKRASIHRTSGALTIRSSSLLEAKQSLRAARGLFNNETPSKTASATKKMQMAEASTTPTVHTLDVAVAAGVGVIAAELSRMFGVDDPTALILVVNGYALDAVGSVLADALLM